MAEIYTEVTDGITSRGRVNMIKVYSKQNCIKCELVKRYLTDKGVPFEEVDVLEDTEALQMLLDEGRSELPVVDINGERHSGFRPEILAKVVN